MSIPESALDLVEDRLDGELDDEAWAQARAEHGPALDAALERARDRRQALADLPRPDLPPALRAAILTRTAKGQTASPSDSADESPNESRQSTAADRSRTPAMLIWGVPVLLAACLVVAILPRIQQPEPTAAAPDRNVARQDQTPAAERDWHDRGRAAHAPAAGAAKVDDPAPSTPAPAATTNEARSSRPVLGLEAEAASDGFTDEETSAPDAHDLQPAELAELTREAESYALRREAATMREAELSMQMQLLVDAAGRRLLLVALHNGGERALKGQRNAITVEGLDANGAVVWRRDLPGFSELTLEPDSAETLTLVLGEDLDPPAAVTTLRLAAGGKHGAPLAIDTSAAGAAQD
ncbi:MAG: hypothetical protein ACOCYP_09230 [Planctomycetota bacterium]